MGQKLVIAEKPMLARDIARAICGKQVSETARLPISGNGYTVIACAGHLLELVEPDAVNPAWGKPWSLDVLPIQIDDWAKEPTEDKKDLVERIDSLLPEAECVINAGDPDDEGQLIVDEVLDYDEETGHWGHGTYYDSLASAAADLEGRAISTPGMEVICPDFWYRDDIEFALDEAGLEVNDENVDAALEALDLDGEPILSNFHDRLAETGNEMIADAVNNIEPNGGGGGGAPEAFVDRGISLKAMAESMRRASQALSANGGTDAPDGKDECQPSFTPDLS